MKRLAGRLGRPQGNRVNDSYQYLPKNVDEIVVRPFAFEFPEDPHRGVWVADESGGTDEDTVESFARNLRVELERCREAVDLRAVGVAFEFDRSQLEPRWGTLPFAQEDGAGAGSENG